MSLFDASALREPKNTAKKGEITEVMVLAKLIQCSTANLRLDATKNNQQKGIHWAEDYEIEKIMECGLLVR